MQTQNKVENFLHEHLGPVTEEIKSNLETNLDDFEDVSEIIKPIKDKEARSDLVDKLVTEFANDKVELTEIDKKWFLILTLALVSYLKSSDNLVEKMGTFCTNLLHEENVTSLDDEAIKIALELSGILYGKLKSLNKSKSEELFSNMVGIILNIQKDDMIRIYALVVIGLHYINIKSEDEWKELDKVIDLYNKYKVDPQRLKKKERKIIEPLFSNKISREGINHLFYKRFLSKEGI